MTIYIDLIIILNFVIDFLLLLSVSILLKRKTKIYKIIISSIAGSFSILFLFLNINSFILFILKIITSAIMVLIAFGFKNLKNFINNMTYLFMNGVILGGFISYLKNEFFLKNDGLKFIKNELSINYIFILLISPFIIYLYNKTSKELKNNYNNYQKCKIYFDTKNYIEVTSFIDTGNKLKDPYTNKNIILLNKKYIPKKIRSPIYVPYHTLNNSGLLKCFKAQHLEIDNKINNNFLIGISEDKIFIDGIDCIISNNIMEGLK